MILKKSLVNIHDKTKSHHFSKQKRVERMQLLPEVYHVLLFFFLDCSYDCHKQCSTLIPNDCSPDKKLVKRVFGVDLTTLIKAHNQRRPQIVEICVHEIEKRGLELKGLYRVPGFADDITYLQNQTNKGQFSFPISKCSFPMLSYLGILFSRH